MVSPRTVKLVQSHDESAILLGTCSTNNQNDPNQDDASNLTMTSMTTLDVEITETWYEQSHEHVPSIQ
jgi:hypothetical protein